ncbi:DNA replication protein DnaC [Novosphingobium sp. 1529]
MEMLGDLLRAETAHRDAASIRYRMTAAKLPAIKDLDGFMFDGTPINEGLIRSLHTGSFLPERRNIVLIGGTGTGKTHLALAITAAVVRAGARGRYFNTVDLVNRLEEEARLGKAGSLAIQLSRLDLVVLDELGYELRAVLMARGFSSEKAEHLSEVYAHLWNFKRRQW